MKFGTVSLAICFALGLFISWSSIIGCGSTVSVKEVDKAAEQNEEDETPKAEENPFELAESGPKPKVVLDEKLFEFGEMELGTERKHVFIVRNEGDAPLKLKKKGKGSTCKCTLSEIAKDEIPPGESAEIELSWIPKKVTTVFEQAAFLWTNDPENEKITLRIKGSVVSVLELRPPNNWVIEKIHEDKPTEMKGIIFSPLLEEFKIHDVTGSDEFVTAEVEPLKPEELKALKAKSGYGIRAKLLPGVPVGKYFGTFTLNTDVKEGAKIDVNLEGHRSGPVQFIPIRGAMFTNRAMFLNLGSFSASEGNSSKISMFVDGELEINETVSSSEFLKINIERDEKFVSKKKQRYILTFAVPPDGPPTVSRGDSLATVKIMTSHPDVKEIHFRVGYVSN